MYLNQIKVKPGNYADSFNVWIPNIAEFIKELETIKNEKGGCTFYINKNKSFDKNGNVAYHVKNVDGNNGLAPLPENEPTSYKTEAEDTDLPF